MRPISQWEEISRIILSQWKRKAITNAFLTKQDWETELARGSVMCQEFDEGVFFLRQRQGYWLLNYYLPKDVSKDGDHSESEARQVLLQHMKEQVEEWDLPVVVEVVGKAEETESYGSIIALWKAVGMQEAITRIRMSKAVTSQTENLACQGIMIQKAKHKDEKEIQQILQTQFSPFYGCLPTEVALREDIEQGDVYKACQDDRIIGILHKKETEKTAEIRHLAVLEPWRCQNVASALLCQYEKDTEGKTKTVWTGADNLVAQHVYEKQGYEADDRISTVLIIEMEKKNGKIE